MSSARVATQWPPLRGVQKTSGASACSRFQASWTSSSAPGGAKRSKSCTRSAGTWAGLGAGSADEGPMRVSGCGSALGEAAVDQQLDAGDVARGGTRQEEDGAGDLQRVADAAQRIAARHDRGA